MRCCCFLPCFGPSKRQKHLRSANANPTATRGAQTHIPEGAIESAIQPTQQKTVAVEEPIDCIAGSKIENEEQSYKYSRTEVNIDGTKEEHEKAVREEKTPQNEEESSESLFSLSIGSGKPVSAAQNAETEVNTPMQMQLPRAVCTPREIVAEPSEKEAKGGNTKLLEEQPQPQPQPQPSCIATGKVNPNEESSGSKLEENNKEEKGPIPAEYRYRDCSDEGYEGINLDDADLDPQESSESLFSLSANSRKRISSAKKAENEVSSAMPGQVREEFSEGRNPDVSSVLNPIENLTQGGRVVKATVVQLLKEDKENINLVMQDGVDIIIPISPEPSLKLSNRRARQKMNEKEIEIGVDTSLSSWLVESETTPSNNSTPKGGRGSPYSHEDRPILGALTLEEISKYSSLSISASSRRSRSRSPDETPIIGTVGSYWSHTGQSKSSATMSSKFNNSGKDAKLNRSSATIKTRLEAAFEASVAET